MGVKTNHRGRGARRILTAGTMALLLAFSLTGTSFASHDLSTLPGSNFEIDDDANLVVDDADMDDWENVDPLVKLDKPTGTADDSLKGSEDTACPQPDTGTIPNNKSDLKEFGVYVEPHSTDPTHPGFLNLFWSRVQEPTGSTNMSFEFNQSTELCTFFTQGGKTENTGATPERTAGDLLITYDIEQGGAQANVALREWSGTAWGPATDLTTSGAAAGTINQTAITGTVNVDAINHLGNTVSHDLGPYTERTFGEAQVDLTAIFDEESCKSFGSAYLKSRSSFSFTSQLKDFIAPEDVELTNCGRIVVNKVDDDDDLLDGAGFTVTPGKTTNGTTATSSLMEEIEDGVFCLDNLLIGVEYTVTESTVPDGYEGEDPKKFTVIDEGNCSGVDADTDPDLVFVNERLTGSILVHKVDDDGELLDGASFVITPGDITMTEYDDGVFCTDGLDLDVEYTVTETPPTGYAGEDAKTFTPTAASTCDERLDEQDPDDPDLTFDNEQLHRVIVVVCHQVDGTLAPSEVTDSDDNTLTTISSDDLDGLDIDEGDLCGLDGFDDLEHGDFDLTVDVGSDAHQ